MMESHWAQHLRLQKLHKNCGGKPEGRRKIFIRGIYGSNGTVTRLCISVTQDLARTLNKR